MLGFVDKLLLSAQLQHPYKHLDFWKPDCFQILALERTHDGAIWLKMWMNNLVNVLGMFDSRFWSVQQGAAVVQRKERRGKHAGDWFLQRVCSLLCVWVCGLQTSTWSYLTTCRSACIDVAAVSDDQLFETFIVSNTENFGDSRNFGDFFGVDTQRCPAFMLCIWIVIQIAIVARCSGAAVVVAVVTRSGCQCGGLETRDQRARLQLALPPLRYHTQQ